MLRLPRFTYLQPTSIDNALRMKQDAGPEGMYVAGGTDLYPNMKRRHQEPKTVIALNGLDDLHHVTINPGEGTAIGAGTTLRDIETHTDLGLEHPVVAKAAELIATPLLRNMGTVGGNLCLDTRCNYYNQSYEWRKCIDFCMKKDGEVCRGRFLQRRRDRVPHEATRRNPRGREAPGGERLGRHVLEAAPPGFVRLPRFGGGGLGGVGRQHGAGRANRTRRRREFPEARPCFERSDRRQRSRR